MTAHFSRIIKNNLSTLLTFILSIILIFYIFVIITISDTTGGPDFVKFYASADLFIQGKSIYTPVKFDAYNEIPNEIREKMTRDTMHPNLNHPFVTLLFLPFGFIDLKLAFIIWSAISFFLGLISVWMIYHSIWNQTSRVYLMWLNLIFFVYFRTFVSVAFGQISLLLLLVLVIAWLALRSNNQLIAGIFLGIALILKLYTGLFILLLLLHKRFKAIFWYIATFILCNLIAVLVFSKNVFEVFLENLNEITWYSSSWNASLLGFITRFLGGSENAPLIDLGKGSFYINYFLSILFLIILIIVIWSQRGDNSQLQFDLLYSLTIVFMLILSPLGWMYYFVLLLIPAVNLWRMKNLYNIKLLGVFTVIAWIMSTIPHGLRSSAEINIADMFIWGGSYFYSLLMFLGLLLWSIIRLNLDSTIDEVESSST